jgi:DnaK suppressor protein
MEPGGTMGQQHGKTKRILLEQRQRLLAQVARLEEDLRWLETNPEPEMVELGQEETLARLAARLDDHDRAELQAIESALERIERGEYGACRACGKRIPSARLQAMPAAEFCLPCAAAREGLTKTP